MAVSVLDAEVSEHVIARLALAHTVVDCRTLPGHHLVFPTEGGAVEAFGQVVVKLGVVVLGARQTEGLLARGAGGPHVVSSLASVTLQRLAACRVRVCKGEEL